MKIYSGPTAPIRTIGIAVFATTITTTAPTITIATTACAHNNSDTSDYTATPAVSPKLATKTQKQTRVLWYSKTAQFRIQIAHVSGNIQF